MSSETAKANHCEECGKSFTSREELTQHMNQEHVGRAWYPYHFFNFVKIFILEVTITSMNLT